MKLILAVLVLLILIASPASAQCTVPGCDAATAVVANGRATGAAILTAVAPPTATTPATMTPQPTATATNTPEPTQTPRPTNTATAQPTQTSAATATMVASATATREPAMQRGRTIYDDWPLLALLGIGALVVVIVAWRLIDGKTITLPRRGRNDDA